MARVANRGWAPLPGQQVLVPGAALAAGRPKRRPEILHPISLLATVVLQPNQSDSPNTMALKNPNAQPMELLEIKFLIGQTTQLANTPGFNGATLACKLTMGSLKISNNFIPVWLYGRGDALVTEQLGIFNGAGPFPNSYCLFSWKLPRPLYVPPGAVLAPEFQHTGQANVPLTVSICYSGRVLARPLDETQAFPVPYVASWQSKGFDVHAADIDSSHETDLVNATNEDVHICRMAGRLTSTAGGGANENNLDDELITIDMFDSRGYPWVQLPAFFRQVFSATTRSWEMPIEPVLPSGTYVIANITKAAATNDNYGAALYYDQVGLSIVGWRSVHPGDVQ